VQATESSSASAISGFVRNTVLAGTLAFSRRLASLAQLSGRYSSQSMGAATLFVARCRLTAIWQFPVAAIDQKGREIGAVFE